MIMVFNATLNNIIVAVSFIGRGNRVPRENHRPVTSHRPTLSQKVVLSTSLPNLNDHTIFNIKILVLWHLSNFCINLYLQ